MASKSKNVQKFCMGGVGFESVDLSLVVLTGEFEGVGSAACALFNDTGIAGNQSFFHGEKVMRSQTQKRINRPCRVCHSTLPSWITGLSAHP